MCAQDIGVVHSSALALCTPEEYYKVFLMMIFLFTIFTMFSNNLHRRCVYERRKGKEKLAAAGTIAMGGGSIIARDITYTNSSTLSTSYASMECPSWLGYF